jgi:alpha-tubulin suppressor-like RCC1 family protein
MRWVGFDNSPYGAGFFISNSGALYTAGNAYRSLQGGTADIITPRELSWLGGKPVKLVHSTNSDVHYTAGVEYTGAICLVCEDGTLYQASDNYGSYGMYGTGYTGSMWWVNSLYPYITNTNVSDAYSFDGGYGRTIILKNDGSIWWSGANQYYIGREVAAADTTTWVQVSPSNLNSVTKLRAMGGQYGGWCAALRSDGKMVAWGMNQVGQCGRSSFDSDLGADNTTFPQYVSLEKTIVDFEMVGYAYGGTNYACLIMLTNQGEIYMCGSNDQFINGDYTGNNTNSPRKVHF